MSLQTLAELRRNRQRPGIVWIVVGKESYMHDRADVVTVLPSDKPAFMDWRPIVGIPVALFTAPGHEALAANTADALQAVGAQLIGSVWRTETLALEEAAKPVLHRAWELLCL